MTCAFPACNYRPVAEYESLRYCAPHAPPRTPCPVCDGEEWRRSVWMNWICRACCPAMGRRLRMEVAG